MMNEERYNHASVALGDFVYVICGENADYVLNSLARLDNKKINSG